MRLKYAPLSLGFTLENEISEFLNNPGHKKVFSLHSEALVKALERRELYFESLQPNQREIALKFQNEIDEELKKAGNQNNRLTVISNMLMEHLKILHKQSAELSSSLVSLSKKIGDLEKHKPSEEN